MKLDFCKVRAQKMTILPSSDFRGWMMMFGGNVGEVSENLGCLHPSVMTVLGKTEWGRVHTPVVLKARAA